MSDVITELANEANDKTMQIARLKADNDRLRKDAAETALMLGAAWEHCSKLRELVRKVLQFERAGCEGCPYASTCDVDCLYEPNCPMREDIERDMRELGVEVDG